MNASVDLISQAQHQLLHSWYAPIPWSIGGSYLAGSAPASPLLVCTNPLEHRWILSRRLSTSFSTPGIPWSIGGSYLAGSAPASPLLVCTNPLEHRLSLSRRLSTSFFTSFMHQFPGASVNLVSQLLHFWYASIPWSGAF